MYNLERKDVHFFLVLVMQVIFSFQYMPGYEKIDFKH